MQNLQDESKDSGVSPVDKHFQCTYSCAVFQVVFRVCIRTTVAKPGQVREM